MSKDTILKKAIKMIFLLGVFLFHVE